MVFTIVALIAALIAVQSPATPAGSIAGAWTRNADLSDKPADRGDRGDRGGDAPGPRNGGYGRGGGRGGYGGGSGGRGMGRGGNNPGAAMNPEATARMRDAIRDLTNPSDHLTIVQTDSMIVVTGADGRTTRLSPDGKKIKDDNTGIERKTKWDGGNLVSEISGLGRGKTTQTFASDPEHHQLRITVRMEGGGRSSDARTITHVYDKD
jgi:hypothetical protein